MKITHNRKQREFEEREQLLIRLADQILSKDGEAELNMDKLVASSEYSKGTVYKHFGCKEDLLTGIYYEKFLILFRLFQKVIDLPLTTRDRQLGIHVAHSLFDYRYFHESARLMAPNTAAMQGKISASRKVKLEQLQLDLQKLLLALIQEAVDQGDLKLPVGISADMVALANQAFSFGMITMMYGSCKTPESYRAFMYAHLESASRLLDGYRWHPISGDCDYRGVVEKVEEALKEDFEELLNGSRIIIE
ncbi:TetR/AcrR family transcriptional regulator [Paenibacillus agricola]|uniref:TetR/AcrR family transcriptional regulator n=1 Tax=Paenibacillus agricola TaxID=2716264 RepID=A0ABX0J6Z6_9BACL|nr:TetR/AcrR family transcriptional regulator [Paenibacillus agricola]NHN31383.1 TetR/AcrR family transcriptional regulator [Paenibacillus agricola]